MPSFDLSPVQISVVVALLCFVAAIVLLLLMSRHSEATTGKPPSIFKRLLSGDTLSQTGQHYRIAVFIALMFAFMNTVGSVVIFLAAQTPPP